MLSVVFASVENESSFAVGGLGASLTTIETVAGLVLVTAASRGEYVKLSIHLVAWVHGFAGVYVDAYLALGRAAFCPQSLQMPRLFRRNCDENKVT